MKERWEIEEHIYVPTDVGMATSKAKAAHEKLKEAKSRSPELRREFIELLIQQAEDNGDTKKAKDLRNIQDSERMREVHKRIKAAQGKLKGGGVKFVERILENGTRETIKDKDEMEREIMVANETKLHSANESPLRQGELANIISDHDIEQWEAVLKGQAELPGNMEEGTRRWLEIIQRTQCQDRELELTVESYTRSWMKPKEHTACCPGPHNFSTFKAMKWCRPAAKLNTIMAQIPIQTGYTPKRWNKCVDSMLPKKPNEWRPSKLRLTALLMPDFNHNNKILGRQAMKWAEEGNILAQEQYGSRKKLSAAKHALNKRLMIDALRIQRRPGVICANDAKACYDRILHFAAYVSLRKTGLKKEAVTSMLRPIRKLQHTIRTAYGDSRQTYGGDSWERDPSGICQGNGAGPAIWALVSSPLLQMLREAGYGAKIHSAIGSTFLHLSGFAFVDDADTVQTGQLGETTEQIMQKAQAQLTLWEEGIRATGGGIEGTKSDFAIMNYKWEEGRWTYEKKQERHKLTVPDGQGGMEELKQLDVAEARRTLGVWQATDGNETKQTEVMKEKSEKWARNVKRSFLSRADIAFGIKTSLYPSLTFGLLATTLTENQAADTFKPIRAHALSNMGYNKHIPKIVVHGPEKYGGIGIKDIYSIQGIEHVKILLEEGGGTSPTSQLLDITIHGHILEIGRSGNLFNMSYEEVGHRMTESWVKNTLKFINQSEIEIETKQHELQLWRQHDQLIMDEIHNTQGHHITQAETEAANRCRIYLRATTKSDITTGDGRNLLRSAWNCKRDWVSPSNKAYRWPEQRRPGKEDIKIWQHILHKTYGVEERYPGWLRILGPWKDNAKEHIQWWYDRSENNLYERLEEGWQRWTTIIRRTRSTAYTRAEVNIDIPHTCHPAMATKTHTNNTTYLEAYDRHTQLATHPRQTRRREVTEPQEQHELLQKLQELPPNLQWALEDIQLPDDNGEAIAASIRANDINVICDGSLKDTFGTSAGKVMDMEEGQGYIVRNRVPGETKDQNSYRSELCGILAHVIILHAIITIHKVDTGGITVVCDNESALWTALGEEKPTAGSASRDILQAIHHITQKTSIKWIRKHVKGHQEDHRPIAELDKWALANIEVDKMAEEFWKQHFSRRPQRVRIGKMPGEGWRLLIRGTPIITDVEDTIYAHRYKKRCTDYWARKQRTLPGAGEEVDWELYGEAIKITPRAKQQWTHKHFCGFEANNYMLKKYGERTDDKCPRCDEIETHTHIVQCQSPGAQKAFDASMGNYGAWLTSTSSPAMAQAILEFMHAYRNTRPLEFQPQWSQKVKRACEQQLAIGTRACIEGCLHPAWERIQSDYLTHIGSKKNARRWMRELILKTWLVSWDLWDSRNDIVHNDSDTRQIQILAVLHQEIRDIHEFARRHRFLTRVAKKFFATPITDIMEGSEYTKRIWVRIGHRYLENDRKRMKRNHSAAFMREWLIPGSTEGRQRQKRQRRQNTQNG